MKLKLNNIKLKLNKKKIIALVVLAAVIVGGVSFRGKGKKVETKQEVKNVKVQKVAKASISTEVEYPSKLMPITEVTVTPKLSGKVSQVNVNVGDTVTAGQTLFALDTAELNAQLQQQQAALTAANANYAKTSDSGLVQQITSAEQALGKYQITYNDAKDNYEKMQKLFDAGAIAKQELDNAKSKFDSASLDLNSAQTNLTLLTEKIGPQSTVAAQASVQQAQAGVNSAQVQLNNAIVTSPITGVVSVKTVEVGEIASGATSSVTVIDSSTLIAEINVPDKMVGKIQVGQQVPVKVNALADKKITGVIDNISPNADDKNHSYTVKVKIDNSKGEIKSGMFAKVSIPAEQKDNILTVPNEAVKIENSVKYIYIVDGGKVKKLSIDTGVSNDKITEVAGNVKEGASIITEGQNLLNDGEKVNVVK